MAISPQKKHHKKMYFIQVNCMGWHVWHTHTQTHIHHTYSVLFCCCLFALFNNQSNKITATTSDWSIADFVSSICWSYLVKYWKLPVNTNPGKQLLLLLLKFCHYLWSLLLVIVVVPALLSPSSLLLLSLTNGSPMHAVSASFLLYLSAQSHL